MSDDQQVLGRAAPADSALLHTLRGALKGTSEAQRGQVLAELLADWAREVSQSTQHRAEADGEQLRALSRKLQDLEHAKADLEDTLGLTRAELLDREKRLEVQEARCAELQATVERHRSRLATLQQEHTALETRLTQHASELHAAEQERERLEVKSQRLELQTTDRSILESLQAENRRLASQLHELQAAHDALRDQKDQLTETVGRQKQGGEADVEKGAVMALQTMWNQMAEVSPPLVKRGGQPNLETGKRLVRSLSDLIWFAQRSEQNLRPFLTKYTKSNPTVHKPWKIYADNADKEDFYQALAQFLDPSAAPDPESFFRKLKKADRWGFASMMTCYNLIELIPQELQAHLADPKGFGADPKCTIRDYVKREGPTLLQEHLIRLYGRMLEEYVRL